MTPIHDAIRTESPRTDRLLWSALVATFVVGDVVTTAYGLRLAGVVESHPVSASVLTSAGVVGMVAAKVVVAAVAAWFYRHADARYADDVDPETLQGDTATE